MAKRMASAIANRMAKPMRLRWQNYAPNPNPNPNPNPKTFTSRGLFGFLPRPAPARRLSDAPGRETAGAGA